jgi:recombinational DNA repair ATPase RecF
MSHDPAFAANKLRGAALAIERGDLDAELAEIGVSIAPRRAEYVRRVRELAAQFEALAARDGDER